jgi:nucleoside-diphosphate-sugar epimerase
VTKLAAEQFGRVYHARHGIECINVRTCWVYGPGLPRARVPKTFIDAAIAGEPFHLEDGDLTVDQVYVTDTVAGVLLALDKANHRYDSYNIATGYAPALREVAAIVRDLVPGARLSVGNGPYLHGAGVPAVKKGALNIERARRELGYAPQYDIRRGLQEMIAAALHTPINKDSN